MHIIRVYYLIAAILGTIFPYYYFASFAVEAGLDVPLFIEQVLSARVSMGFVVDLFISSFVFWPFLFKEAKRLGTPNPWLFVFLNLAVGLSCALPAFLYYRERNESK